jgi:hypothetical protein
MEQRGGGDALQIVKARSLALKRSGEADVEPDSTRGTTESDVAAEEVGRRRRDGQERSS